LILNSAYYANNYAGIFDTGLNASGQILPPMLIFDAKKMCHAWIQGKVPGTIYGPSYVCICMGEPPRQVRPWPD